MQHVPLPTTTDIKPRKTRYTPDNTDTSEIYSISEIGFKMFENCGISQFFVLCFSCSWPLFSAWADVEREQHVRGIDVKPLKIPENRKCASEPLSETYGSADEVRINVFSKFGTLF